MKYINEQVIAFHAEKRRVRSEGFVRAKAGTEGIVEFEDRTDFHVLLSDGTSLLVGKDRKVPENFTKIGKYFVPDLSRLEILFSDGEETYIKHIGLVKGDFTPKGEY